MALSSLDNLYRQVILDHSAHPHHHGHLQQVTNEIEMRNPTCGDVIQLEVAVFNDKINDIAFSGDGCTISQASASMMTDAVIGNTPAQAEEMVQVFSKMIIGDQPNLDTKILEDASVLNGVAKFPARIKCAALAWKALNNALTSNDGKGKAGQIVEHHDN
ncbi:Fe-S cluster assembly sulfur transfer protein SufU [Loigolactobacillus backii]|uniref:Fe-S cluster assembly sulfur transfer protein SufU n=1 Tax=Loigolactobacillus backii TaxID=375175 RepID=UPI0007F1289E|nr:SUF system NifU family Fe-S cluster assembly protein [Loigolactobacillus backii]ANK66762.1 iron-sulfur cluster assembly scaffold protein [Loigolactobacillus backii]OLF69241.1 nitrogen fixation protein NifU [Loigolactobacillus backii]PIO87475.1 SUF system NifU family Fe-S cluster assembly protein [Loigolactobacillus backii]